MVTSFDGAKNLVVAHVGSQDADTDRQKRKGGLEERKYTIRTKSA